ncbi:hypothetical protein M9435_002688 [Picochlorum sp. BPE23]|nr:hypothetical protein M9435_002688 [Picochlorum sp. BPE23]
MDRQEFIRLAVQALEEQLASSSPSSRAAVDQETPSSEEHHHQQEEDDDDWRKDKGDLYARLTFDYPLLEDDDDAVSLIRFCTTDMERGAEGVIASYMMEADGRARRTIMENLHRGASSDQGGGQVVLWQELYGLHLFFTISMVEIPLDIHDGYYKTFFWPDTLDTLLLDDAWESGSLVRACETCLNRIVVGADDERIQRMNMFMSLLQQVCRRSRKVAHAVYSMLLAWKTADAHAAMMKEFRILLGHMTANIVMDSDVVTWSDVLRVLTDMISVELADRHHSDTKSLVLAAAACIEYLVRTMPKVPSSQNRIESIMIQKGVYICCIQAFIREPQCTACARVLLLLACYSDQLFQWACRVPGYCMAWNTLRESCHTEDDGAKTASLDGRDVPTLKLEERMLCAMWNGIMMSHASTQEHGNFDTYDIIPPSLLSDIVSSCTLINHGEEEEEGKEEEEKKGKETNAIMMMTEASMMTEVKHMLGTLLLVCSTLLTQKHKAPAQGKIISAVLPAQETIGSLRASCRQRIQFIRMHHMDDSNRRTAATAVLEVLQSCDTLLKRVDVIMSHDGRDDKLQ